MMQKMIKYQNLLQKKSGIMPTYDFIERQV